MKFILRLIGSLFLMLSSSYVFAAIYTFTGNGNWEIASNWAGGLVPPDGIGSGNTVIINGSATTGSGLYGINGGTITIASGGTLSIDTDYSFEISAGTINVQGTLVCWAAPTTITGSSVQINVSGTIITKSFLLNGVNAPIIISSSGTFYNGGTPSSPRQGAVVGGNITVNPGGTFLSTSLGKLLGNTTINGNLTNSGNLAPGNSPGIYTIDGDYTATASSVHNFEIAGTDVANYDRLQASGAVNLSGSLNATLINGFIPSATNDLTIITGNVNGTFSSVNIPAGYTIVYNSNSVILRFLVPLPVNFISFDALKVNSGVHLVWKVSAEESVLKYEVEKSEDGREFNRLGEIQAANQNTYDFVDRQFNSKSYYRIKSIDSDGKFRYSSIITFNSDKSIVELSLFPNPAKDLITIQHSLARKGSTISVISSAGTTVKVIMPKTDTQQTSIDLTGLGRGLYFIQYCNSKGIIQMVKFSRQ